ncbi:hypothetical protein RvY_08519-1 [Ramazzottius varieornatus]|uniref:Uncharacterized protein n=1 Tax=Ramazzottius varieornatus TaxID=947166 RepID=A0A1D1V667_RAMVA|nr:hypothetical protein RvY_08519-1 [Ramazzottius varieornatus]
MTFLLHASVLVGLLYCATTFWIPGVSAQSDDVSSFHADDVHGYPILRRHWMKVRQVSPAMRSFISVPVPRAGKRALWPSAFHAPLVELRTMNPRSDPSFQVPNPEIATLTDTSGNYVPKYKKFSWRSFGKSPIFWPIQTYP